MRNNRVCKSKNGIDRVPVMVTCEYGAYSITLLKTKKYGKEREIVYAQTDFDFPSVASTLGFRGYKGEDATKEIAAAIKYLDKRLGTVIRLPVCAVDNYPAFEVTE
jgi:hypothetical protein